MKKNLSLIGWFACVAFVLPLSHARATDFSRQLTTYPGPHGMAASDQYLVRVIQDGVVRESFVYQSNIRWLVARKNPNLPDDPTVRQSTMSYTTFSFSGPVTIEATKLTGEAKTCVVRPTHLGIKPELRGNTAVFTIDQPMKVSVEFDDDLIHGLLIFADPPEEPAPNKDDPHVRYFGPGVHDIGMANDLADGTTVYIAGGAYVHGSFYLEGKKDITIRGRGVLSGEKFSRGPADLKDMHFNLVHMIDAQNPHIEGVSFVDPAKMCITIYGDGAVIQNIKCIGWISGGDGVTAGGNALIEDSFFHCNDDSIKLYYEDVVVRRCVIWQYYNGACFQLGWRPENRRGFQVSDIDVIHAEWVDDRRWNSVIDGFMKTGEGDMRDYVFRNIRVEGPIMKFLKIAAGDQATLSNLSLENVQIDGPIMVPGAISAASVSNILFKNVTVGGVVADSLDDLKIETDWTDAVRFETN